VNHFPAEPLGLRAHLPGEDGGQRAALPARPGPRRADENHRREAFLGHVVHHIQDAQVPHGLRSTFRQWAAERGYPRDMAEIVLAHFIGSEVERA
jgi:integrase